MPKTKKTEANKIKKPTIKPPIVAEADQPEKKKKARHTYIYAVGRRKKAIARVRMYKNGEGKVIVNQREIGVYFPTFELQQTALEALIKCNKLKDFDVSIKVVGGGINGQAQACRLGIARALMITDKDLKPILKSHNLLRRDPRRKERKKPGLKRARRAPQWSKR